MKHTGIQLTITNDATPTLIKSFSIAEGQVVWVCAKVTCRESTGASRGYWHLEGVFYRNSGGNVTQQGATGSLVAIDSTGGSLTTTLNATVATQTIDVMVTSLAVGVVNWICEFTAESQV